MQTRCTLGTFLLCGRQRRDLRFLSALKSHLAPAERRGVITLSDSQSLPAGSSRADLTTAIEKADVLALIVTPDYYCLEEFRDVVAPAAKRRFASRDGLVVGIFPVPFDATGELDWLCAIPEYSKASGRPRPGRPESILADAARCLLAKLEVDDMEGSAPRYESPDHRAMAQELRCAYRLAELRGRSPHAITDVESLHAALRRKGEAVAGDFLGGGRFELLSRRRYHGPMEEWTALDRRGRAQVRVFLLTSATHAGLPPEDAELAHFARATADLHSASPKSLIEPLRHERGLGWFFIAEAAR